MQCIWRQDRSTGWETWRLFNVGLCFEAVETRGNSGMKSLCRKGVIFLTVSFQDRNVRSLWVWRWHLEQFIYIYYNNKRSRSQSSIAGENMCQCPVRFSGRRRLVAAAVSSKWGAGTLNRYVGLFQRVPSQNPDWNRLDQDVAHLTHTSTLYISVYLCFVSLGLGHADTWLSLFSVTIWRDSQHHSPDFDPLGLHSVGFMVLKFLLLLSLAISALEVKRLC